MNLAGGACNIVCTQPRRISAISLAERVAQEQGQKIGNWVGYKIRGESRATQDTRLTFMTTGILLRMIQFDPLLADISHIVFDEVHERTMDGDLLLVLLKDLLAKRPDVKVILMSATLDANAFATYFNGAPVLMIPGFTHPVEDVYLEDYITQFIPDADVGDYDSDDWEGIERASRMGKKEKKEKKEDVKINYKLIADLVSSICSDAESKEGAILIFLPGTFTFLDCSLNLTLI